MSIDTTFIFLDIDGVLNLEPINTYVFDKDCLTHFENAVRSLGDVKIVISSTWRLAFSLKEVRQHFSDDIKPIIVGFTPSYNGEKIEYERYKEVLIYLKRKDIMNAKWISFTPDLTNFISPKIKYFSRSTRTVRTAFYKYNFISLFHIEAVSSSLVSLFINDEQLIIMRNFDFVLGCCNHYHGLY